MDRFKGLLSLVPTMLVGASGGGLAYAADMPLPWLLGAMLVTAVLSLMNVRLSPPRASRKVVLAVIGVMLGSAFTPNVAGNLCDWGASLVIMLVGTLFMTGVSVWLSYRVAGNSLATAIYSGMPGGISTVTLMAADSDADLRIVGLTHAVRILVLLLVIPLILNTIGHVNLEQGTTTLAQWLFMPSIGESVILIVAGVGGAWLGLCLRLPNPLLFGPVLVSAALHMTGVSEAAIPPMLAAMAQVIIGVSIGVRFLGTTLAAMRLNLVVSVFQAFILILIAAVAAWLGHVVTGYSPAATLLAYVPGGAPELSLVALSLGIEPAFVTSHHLMRISVLILAMPLLFTCIRKRKAICILGLEYIHSNPRFLVGQKGASGWIFLFFTTLRKSNIGWILRRALSRVNPTPHLLPASTMSECAAHTRPCLVLLEYHCRPCGLLWSTTSLHG